MKRMAGLLLALLLLLSLCACAEKEPNAPTTDKDKKEENTESDGFFVKNGSVKIELGVDAAAVLRKLGEANSAQEVFDCGAGNSRMYYRYSSFDLYTMKSSDGKEIVDQIELLDDLSETEKGISIGSAESALREAYGEPSSESDGELTYAQGDQRMIFEVTDGKVSAIGLLRVTK
jgi:predicted small lipoprotein YifL